MTIGCILKSKGRDVAKVGPDTSLRDVANLLAAKHIGALLVMSDGGEMLGIVSERDIVRAVAADGGNALADPVSQVMTRNVVTADEDDSVVTAAQTMSKGRFRHLPVVKDGRVVGVISTGDAIKYRLEQMEQEHSALKEYIATA